MIRLKEIVENCHNGGQHQLTSFRKVPAIATVAGCVVDISMAPGSPRANFYTGDAMMSRALYDIDTARIGRGLWHGGNVTPQTKHLRRIMAFGSIAGIAPANFTVCDYLIFYPLIDMDSTDEQFFINYGAVAGPTTDPLAAVLPRYTTGAGVRAFIVATNPYIGGAQFYINYTNSAGVSGRISPIMTSNTSTYIGTLIHSGPAAGSQGTLIALAQGDIGVRSVESITFLSGNGGLATLVLCKPLVNFYMRETTTYSEWDFLTMKPGLPRIYDGAYISFLCAASATTAAGIFMGTIETIWN